MESSWNPWHGCHKLSEGCQNCYVYRMDARHEKNASEVRLTGDYLLPLRKKRDGSWKIPAGSFVWTCFTSDFLLEDADDWRPEAWEAIRRRPDCDFLFITKRIHRLHECLPPDWGVGWENVRICCTCENQTRADFRLPIFRDAPIRHKSIVCEPLLGPIDLASYLGPWVEQVSVGGESGTEARVCDYGWVLDIRGQCASAGVPFVFRQTGARLKKDGKIYRIERRNQHSQAQKAGINYNPPRR